MTHDLDHDFRTLDPAGPAGPATNGLSDRALEDLHRILAAPRHGQPVGTPVRPRSPRQTWTRRLVPAALLLGGAAVLLPSLGGGDPAFATWTARPAALPADDIPGLAAECTSQWEEPVANDLQLKLAEQRGEWRYAVLATPDGTFVDCMLAEQSGIFGQERTAGAGRAEFRPTDAPTGGDIEALVYGGQRQGYEPMAYVAVSGRAGPDVTTVRAHTPTRGDVNASVQNGFWAAWWPVQLADGEDLDLTGLTLTVTTTGGDTTELTYPDVAADRSP